MTQISAKTRSTPLTRVSQCDIFHDLEVVQDIIPNCNGIEVVSLKFPLMICLNQDCDLNSDNRDKQNPSSNKDCRLLHLIFAPVFNFDLFRQGKHWGEIFQIGQNYNPNRTDGKKIMNNEDPRFHFLHFEDKRLFPDLVIDFKHFYTVSTEYINKNLDKRVCSIEDLYREKISQRFAYYLSRIGLPDIIDQPHGV